MCNCLTIRRIPDDETENGRWPMPKHAPNCEDFKQQRYIRLYNEDGTGFVDTVENQYAYMSSDDYEGLRQEYVYLTEDQFEKLLEFQGF